MAERCRAQGENGRAHLWVGDDLDAEDVGESGAQSLRKARKMRFSPFWLKMRMPESIVLFFFYFSLSGIYYILCVRSGED